MIRNGTIFCVLFAILFATVGCGQKSIPTERPYVFIDDSGNEHRGFYIQPELPDPAVGKSGTLTVFYEDGKKWMEGNLIGGEFDGTVRMWRPDGTVIIEEQYRSGKKHGRHVWYNPDGSVDFEVEWVDGKKKE